MNRVTLTTHMQASSHTVCWSAGDIAYIADGEFSGTLARIWEIKLTENKAVISLCVFRENTPFEIELSSLQKPSSPRRAWTKAVFFLSITTLAGPFLLIVYLLIIDFGIGQRSTPLFSVEVIALVLSWPIYVSGLAAVYVGIRVLTDQDTPG